MAAFPAGARIRRNQTVSEGSTSMSQNASGPLVGLKVLELGQLIAGPFAGKFFSDFDAGVSAFPWNTTKKLWKALSATGKCWRPNYGS